MAAAEYSATEIVDIARQVERCGEEFYAQAARRVKDARVRELFLHLQREEVSHAATFEEVLGRLKLGPADWRNDDDYVAYMRALADSRVFPGPEAAAAAVAGLHGERDAIEFAIRFEKDTILYLLGLKRMVQAADHATLDELVAEEETHVARLSAMARSLPA